MKKCTLSKIVIATAASTVILAGSANARYITASESYSLSKHFITKQDDRKSARDFSWLDTVKKDINFKDLKELKGKKFKERIAKMDKKRKGSRNHGDKNKPTVSVPEPSSIALLALGLLGLGISRSRKA